MTAVPLAHQRGGPVLLTWKGGLSSATSTELRRLGATSATLLATDGDIGAGARRQLDSMGIAYRRVDSTSHAGTARKVAALLRGSDVVSATRFAHYHQPLILSRYTARAGAPLVWLDGGLPVPTDRTIRARSPRVITLAGPASAFPDTTLQFLTGYRR